MSDNLSILNILETIKWMLLILTVGFLAICFAYLCGRAASIGWYKGKWEHFKRVDNHTIKGEE